MLSGTSCRFSVRLRAVTTISCNVAPTEVSSSARTVARSEIRPGRKSATATASATFECLLALVMFRPVHLAALTAPLPIAIERPLSCRS